jgi:hypothetical protein
MIKRYHRKPDPPPRGDVYAARYQPGQPLDDLREVAQMADSHAELAEVTLPSVTVLLIRWHNEHSDVDWEHVEPGHYLVYSATYDNLVSDTEQGLAYFYEPSLASA